MCTNMIWSSNFLKIGFAPIWRCCNIYSIYLFYFIIGLLKCHNSYTLKTYSLLEFIQAFNNLMVSNQENVIKFSIITPISHNINQSYHLGVLFWQWGDFYHYHQWPPTILCKKMRMNSLLLKEIWLLCAFC